MRSTPSVPGFCVWGMIGEEFKTARQHLLKNLDGNIAWKDPAQAQQQRERLLQQRLEQQARSCSSAPLLWLNRWEQSSGRKQRLSWQWKCNEEDEWEKYMLRMEAT